MKDAAPLGLDWPPCVALDVGLAVPDGVVPLLGRVVFEEVSMYDSVNELPRQTLIASSYTVLGVSALQNYKETEQKDQP